MKEKEMTGRLASEVKNWLADDEAQLKFVFGHEVGDEDLDEVLAASVQVQAPKCASQCFAGVCL